MAHYQTDPLVCLCKLAILYFMPPGTKLAFGEHTIHIQAYTCYQWLERSLSRDSRTDISLLHCPLMQAIKHYLTEEAGEDIRTIARYSVKGLATMRDQTYSESDSVRIVLQYYINHLQSALSGTWKEENCLSPVPPVTVLESPGYEHTAATVARMLVDADHSDRTCDDAKALVKCTHSLLRSRDKAFLNTVTPRVPYVE